MNEQIKLFAEQARLLTGWPVGEVEYQKFAELLIFECVKIAVFNGNHVTAVAIKEKFGVGK